MGKQSDMLCKEIGWNGIRVQIPEEWETAEIAKRYLLFENKSEAMMEIRWEKITGKFSLKKQLGKLSGYQKKSGSVRECPLPEKWKKSLSAFISRNGPCDSLAFQWKEGKQVAQGLLLFLPASGQVILLRFFPEKSGKTEDISSRVLSSLQTVPADNQHLWAVFDIRLFLPAEWQIRQFRFAPGEFRLEFVKKSAHLQFFRWSPADFLLRNIGLQEFTRSRFHIPPENLHPTEIKENKGFAWKQERKKTGIFRFFIGKKTYGEHGILWHIPAANRIMGLIGENIREEEFDFLCRSRVYEIRNG